MFNFRKKKNARKEIDNYVIELSKDKVIVRPKAAIWRLEYDSHTTPYVMISSLWDKDEILFVVCLYLQTYVSMVSDGEFVSKAITLAIDYVESKTVAPKVSKAEDEEILRETQVLQEQTVEAVEKHSEAVKKNTKRKKKNDRKTN